MSDASYAQVTGELDLINRQNAIDDLHGKDPSRIWDTADIEVWLNDLPSAEPKTRLVAEITLNQEQIQSAVDNAVEKIRAEMEEPEIIRCRDCKHRNDYDVCPMTHVEWVEYNDDGYIESDDILYDYTQDDGFCHKAER